MQPTPRNAKALYLDPNANPGQVEGNNRNTNTLEEEGVTMTTTVAVQAEKFDTTIDVAGAKVSPWSRNDGALTVELDFGDEGGIKSFTPEAACALATAISAVAVHVMEQRSEVAA